MKPTMQLIPYELIVTLINSLAHGPVQQTSIKWAYRSSRWEAGSETEALQVEARTAEASHVEASGSIPLGTRCRVTAYQVEDIQVVSCPFLAWKPE
jgi:hypothetical protein